MGSAAQVGTGWGGIPFGILVRITQETSLYTPSGRPLAWRGVYISRLRPCRRPLCLLVGGLDWGLVICSLGGAFSVFVMVFEGARRSFLSSRWSVWRAGGVLTGKLGTWVDYDSVSSLKTGPR